MHVPFTTFPITEFPQEAREEKVDSCPDQFLLGGHVFTEN